MPKADLECNSPVGFIARASMVEFKRYCTEINRISVQIASRRALGTVSAAIISDPPGGPNPIFDPKSVADSAGRASGVMGTD